MRNDLIENITPEVGDKFVNIPITIDSKPGRGGRFRGQMIASGVSLVIYIFLLIVTLKNGEIGILDKVLRFLLYTVVISFFVRFVVMRENKLYKQYKKLESTDFQFNISNLWGIYGQSEVYPSIFYATGGKLISIVKMQKDVTIGKKEQDRFNHFEAIGDALNYAANSGMRVMHVDYMDSVGNDNRLDLWYNDVVETKNQDFKEFYSLMYNHLVESVRSHMSFEDVYVLCSQDTESLFAFKVEQFALELKNGNYTSFRYLDREEVQDFVCSVYNLHEFSFLEAAQGVFNREELGNITPIEVVHDGVLEKLGLTFEERREKAAEAEKQKKMGKKSKRQVSKKEEDLDIF